MPYTPDPNPGSRASIHQRHPLSAPGKFFVDDQCLDCNLCRETAPEVFRRDDECGVSYLVRQPVTEQEIALVEESVEGCPHEAIGDTGDQHDWAKLPPSMGQFSELSLVQNELFELHDSTIEHASVLNDSVVLTLSVNIHRSHGQPGLHLGTVWRQQAILTFFGAEKPSVREFPATISGGALGVGILTYRNLVPTVSSFKRAIQFSVTFDDGEPYCVRAEGLDIELRGEPQFIENFPGQ